LWKAEKYLALARNQSLTNINYMPYICKIYNFYPNVEIKWVTLLVRIQKVMDSILGPETLSHFETFRVCFILIRQIRRYRRSYCKKTRHL
jgi:hypothetical protein